MVDYVKKDSIDLDSCICSDCDLWYPLSVIIAKLTYQQISDLLHDYDPEELCAISGALKSNWRSAYAHVNRELLNCFIGLCEYHKYKFEPVRQLYIKMNLEPIVEKGKGIPIPKHKCSTPHCNNHNCTDKRYLAVCEAESQMFQQSLQTVKKILKQTSKP